MALPRGATGLSAVCDCGISRSYSLTIFIYLDIKYDPKLLIVEFHFIAILWKFEEGGPVIPYEKVNE